MITAPSNIGRVALVGIALLGVTGLTYALFQPVAPVLRQNASSLNIGTIVDVWFENGAVFGCTVDMVETHEREDGYAEHTILLRGRALRSHVSHGRGRSRSSSASPSSASPSSASPSSASPSSASSSSASTAASPPAASPPASRLPHFGRAVHAPSQLEHVTTQ